MELADERRRRERERASPEWRAACGALLARVRDAAPARRSVLLERKANLPVDRYMAARVLAAHRTRGARLVARLREEEDEAAEAAEARGAERAAHAALAGAAACRNLVSACRPAARELRANSEALAHLYDPVLLVAEAAGALPRPSAYRSDAPGAGDAAAGPASVLEEERGRTGAAAGRAAGRARPGGGAVRTPERAVR